jgi:hypothetical protein
MRCFLQLPWAGRTLGLKRLDASSQPGEDGIGERGAVEVSRFLGGGANEAKGLRSESGGIDALGAVGGDGASAIIGSLSGCLGRTPVVRDVPESACASADMVREVSDTVLLTRCEGARGGSGRLLAESDIKEGAKV